MKTNRHERELERGMDSLIGEMNGMYGTPYERMGEEAKLEREISDVQLRDDMVSHTEEVIRCRKMSERFLDDEKIDVTYTVQTEVSSKGVVCRVTVKDAVKVA